MDSQSFPEWMGSRCPVCTATVWPRRGLFLGRACGIQLQADHIAE